MTEYGARLPKCGAIYLKSYSLETITTWISEHSPITPLEFVTREWDGESHGRWH